MFIQRNEEAIWLRAFLQVYNISVACIRLGWILGESTVCSLNLKNLALAYDHKMRHHEILGPVLIGSSVCVFALRLFIYHVWVV